MSDTLQAIVYTDEYITALLESEAATVAAKGDLEGFVKSVVGTTPGTIVNDRYERTVSSIQLSVEGNVSIMHGFFKHPTTIRIINNLGIKIQSDSEEQIILQDGSFAVVLNLLSYAPFTDYKITLEV
jgi:hypothetical protein